MFNTSCAIRELEGIAAFSVNILSALFGSFGNILVCVTVFSSPRLHKAWCYFICSLSVADLLVNLCVQPMEAILTLERMTGVCKQSLRDAFRLAAYITCGASLMNLAFMSVERLLAIAWPFSQRQVLTRQKILVMLVIMWGVPSFLGITGFMAGKGTRLSSILILIGLAGCYCVILTSYGILFLRTRAHFKVNNAMTLTESQFEKEDKNGTNSPGAGRVFDTRTAMSKKRRESEKRAAKTIAVVITVFTLSWVPYGYVLVSDPEQHVNSFYIWAVTIGLTNSAVNPVIYFFSSKDFRESSKRILRSIFRC
ncbi:alpha-1B adrenergic receptor-like [Oculina patagonica]